MPVRWLNPSTILRVERFRSFDEFRPNDVIGGGVSVPADPRHSAAFRAILPLRDGLLVLQRSFARRLEANLGADLGVGLMVPLAFHASINNCQIDNSMLALIRGKTPVQATEQHPNTYLMLRFNSDMRNRGWDDFDAGVKYARPGDARMRRLRSAIVDLFCLASSCGDLALFDRLSGQLQEALVAGLDDALVLDSVVRARPGTFDKHRRLVEQLDEQANALGVAPLYSADLAHSLGVSVRTLQTAVQQVCGISLHQHLRSNRLWSVRRLLVTGSSLLTVTAAAQANGFWHMSDFSRTYYRAFGETPSETLARARGR